MIFDFYTGQMLRLQNTFGKNAYPPERVNLYWDIVKDNANDAFKSWVDLKISNSRTPPIGEDFREFSKSQDRNALKNTLTAISLKKITDMPADTWKTHVYSCLKCRDEGLLLARKKEDKTDWAFVCDCETGETSHWKDIKQIKDEPAFKIRKWKEQSIETKNLYDLGGVL